ncbi:P-loop containing nucleoside triphosphate hydrolase protein [Aspergillus aurantiobrunneus]
MARLGRLVSAQTQMVFLTATLPPTDEAQFIRQIQHQPREVAIYRARTSRRNVAYRVFRPQLPRGVPREPHQWLTSAGVVNFIQERIQQARDGRVIIYANIKSQVDAISRELGCEPYHSAVLDRTGVMQWFQSGQMRVIAATSALGMGIDIPDIRRVAGLGGMGWPVRLSLSIQTAGMMQIHGLTGSLRLILSGCRHTWRWWQGQDVGVMCWISIWMGW